VSDASPDYNAIAVWRPSLTPVQASGQHVVAVATAANPRASRWHVENPHFHGVLVIRTAKPAFFQRFSRLFSCVIKFPWL